MCAGSASDADRRCGKHREQVTRQSLAGLPILEANDVALRAVELRRLREMLVAESK
jgi:hypothetical protein